MNELTTSIWLILINVVLASQISICLVGIATTFRILNFFLLILIGCYFFIKKIKPSIKEAIAAQLSEQKELHAQELKLQIQEKNIIIAQEQQKNHIALLNLKLNAWNNHFNRFKDAQIQQKNHTSAAIENRIAIQAQAVADKTLHSIIASSDVLHNVEKKLKEKFANKEDGEQFINAIIKHLNERVA